MTDHAPSPADDADDLDAIAPEEISAPAEEAKGGPLPKLSQDRLRSLCEALLLVSERPLSAKAVHELVGGDIADILAAFDALGGEYREGIRGVAVQEIGGGYQLRTCPTLAPWVRQFLQVKPQRLTRPALETLAVVAYRQPVTRPEIEEIRGVDCGAVLKALLERGMLQVLGKKDEPGRPLLYGTTGAFLEFFGLRDLASLPTLREFHELSEEHRDVVDESFPGGGGQLLEGLREGPGLPDDREEDERALGALDAALGRVEGADSALIGTLDGPSTAPGPEGPDAPAPDSAPDPSPTPEADKDEQ